MSQVQVFTSKVREKVDTKQPATSERKDPLSQITNTALEKLRPIMQQQIRETTVVDKVLEVTDPKVNTPSPAKLGGAKDFGSEKTEKRGVSEVRESRLDAPRTEKKVERTPDTIILPTLQTHTANALREIVKHEIIEHFNHGDSSKTKEEEEEELEKILAGTPYLQKKAIVEKAVETVESTAKAAHVSKIDLHAILKILAKIKNELIDDKKESDTQKRVSDFMKQFK